MAQFAEDYVRAAARGVPRCRDESTDSRSGRVDASLPSPLLRACHRHIQRASLETRDNPSGPFVRVKKMVPRLRTPAREPRFPELVDKLPACQYAKAIAKVRERYWLLS